MPLLRVALQPASALLPAVVNGMDAFLARDRTLIALGERPKIGDSLDLDEAFRESFPNANRWDYVFSVPSASKLIALEPHTANDSEISVLIAKKRHAAAQLRQHLRPQYGVSEWLLGFARAQLIQSHGTSDATPRTGWDQVLGQVGRSSRLTQHDAALNILAEALFAGR